MLFAFLLAQLPVCVWTRVIVHFQSLCTEVLLCKDNGTLTTVDTLLAYTLRDNRCPSQSAIVVVWSIPSVPL